MLQFDAGLPAIDAAWITALLSIYVFAGIYLLYAAHPGNQRP